MSCAAAATPGHGSTPSRPMDDASAALRHELTLVTRTVRHDGRIAGLPLESPA